MEITVADDISAEYRGLVQSILTIPNSKSFNGIRHFQTTRFMHSLNVSYISRLIARKLGWDAQTAARAGLLHDFCVYDFQRDKLPKGEIQAYYHPRVAASTSERHFLIFDKERQAILSHMFPLGPLPESREAWLISALPINSVPFQSFAASALLWHGIWLLSATADPNPCEYLFFQAIE